MDKVVKVLFFKVTGREGGGLDFAGQLLDFERRQPRPLDREFRTTAENFGGKLIRLEELTPQQDFLAGNFCRIQSDNIPPEVTDDGLQAVILANGRGLGHQNAFLYHVPTKVLLWQQNRMGVSFSDLAIYLNKDANQNSLFAFVPITSPESWQNFNNNNPRKAIVKFAGERYVQPADDEVIPAIAQARDIAERYRGLEVEITVSVGRSRTSFLDKIRLGQTIRRLMLRDDVSKIQVMTDGELAEKHIDFLEEHMKNIRELDLPSDNPSDNYQIRQFFLQETFNERLEDLNNRFSE